MVKFLDPSFLSSDSQLNLSKICNQQIHLPYFAKIYG